MKNRKAFTLIELLVVIGIIAVLAGILLPAINHMRIKAMITAQQSDFQSISTALEQYKADFGDYPRNTVLPRWNTFQGGTNTPAPIFLSLASALIGPGPGMAQTTGGGIYETGDGADGFGFRAQTMNFPITVSALTPTITISSAIPPQLNTFVPGQTIALLTMSVGTIYEETVGIANFSGTTLTLAAQPIFNTTSQHQTTDSYVLRIATGKVWGPYLSADNFKVAFVPTTLAGGPVSGAYGPAGQPVLLDKWGQVIQYFPRYGQVSNGTNDSISYTSGTDNTVLAGPLYGYSEPWSIEGKSVSGNGQNAIWDFRDGAPFFTNASLTSPAQAWGDIPAVASPSSPGFYPEQAILWMLGNNLTDATSNRFTNAIRSPDKFSSTVGPFILISAGPDGPNRPNGGYANLIDPASSTGNLLPANQLQSAFTSSGNIYNFDRQ